MSRSQFHSIKLFILRHAWLNLWDKHMTTGRINQVTFFVRKITFASQHPTETARIAPNWEWRRYKCDLTHRSGFEHHCWRRPTAISENRGIRWELQKVLLRGATTLWLFRPISLHISSYKATAQVEGPNTRLSEDRCLMQVTSKQTSSTRWERMFVSILANE